MTGIDSNQGSLYKTPLARKFGLYTITENGFLNNHDIKLDTQNINGKPVALTIQVAHPGALALDKDTFEKRKEPTAYIKCDYDNYPKNRLYDMVRKVVRFFDDYSKDKNEQYFAMHGTYAARITKDQFDKKDYYIDRELISG